MGKHARGAKDCAYCACSWAAWLESDGDREINVCLCCRWGGDIDEILAEGEMHCDPTCPKCRELVHAYRAAHGTPSQNE